MQFVPLYCCAFDKDFDSYGFYMIFGFIAAAIMIVFSLIDYGTNMCSTKKKKELSSVKYEDKEIEDKEIVENNENLRNELKE